MIRRLIALLVVLALFVVACSGDDSSETTALADTEEQLLLFTECMREQGIDLPDPSVGPDGFPQFEPPKDFDPNDTDAIFDAVEECREFLEGVSLGFEDLDITAITDTLVEFAACMRDNGYDLPDPDFSIIQPRSGSMPNAGPFGDIDLTDADFLDAFEVCDDLITNLGVPLPGR